MLIFSGEEMKEHGGFRRLKSVDHNIKRGEKEDRLGEEVEG